MENPLPRTARDLGVGEACGVPLALPGRDPREGAVEMGVLDDEAGHERRLMARMEPIGKHAAVPRIVTVPSVAVLVVEERRRRSSARAFGRCFNSSS
jgi:hypothetical protein